MLATYFGLATRPALRDVPAVETPTDTLRLRLQRSASELASYQKKLIRIDDHIGVAIAGLTSDARVLS